MNELLGRLSAVFVESAPTKTRPLRAPGAAPAIAVLCSPVDAVAVGSTVALAAARRARSSIGVAALWRPGTSAMFGVTAPPVRRARRLVKSLQARDLRASAAGRLVRVELPAEPEAAIASAARAEVTTDAPMVVVVAGPREAAIDRLLTEHDLLLLAVGDESDPLVDLAHDSLAQLGPRVATIPAAVPPLTRALAVWGLGPGKGLPAIEALA
ncbi:MAG: hypothetical protein ACR2ML_02255 [Solirubrobacteraceae bacterium]